MRIFNESDLSRRFAWIMWWSFAAAALVFLYLPVLLLILFSFNDSTLPNLPIRALTLRWYRDLFEDAQVWKAAWNSLSLASVTALISTLLGALAAFPLVRCAFRFKENARLFLLLPVLIPEFLLGVALLVFFFLLDIRLWLGTAVAGHVVIALPFTTLIIASRLLQFDRSLEAAAADLGACPWKVFWHVTLPLIAPGVLAGGLMAFTLSMDQFLVTFFTIGPDTTLPIYIWSALKFELTPKINALGAIVFFVSFVLVLVVYGLGGLRPVTRSRG
ncbi:MAG: ABC transporter permease [Acidobacteria bacterium]|nr:ABC transporter permease [Acidobacteriota bacterium]